jgi:hypothetical protein
MTNKKGSGRPAVRLRPSQAKAFDVIGPAQFGILNGPTGWGKTLLQVAVAGQRLLSDENHRILIAIPQNVISKGFVKPVRIELPGGQVVDWAVGENLCMRRPAKAEALKNFLSGRPGQSVESRVMVATHSGLASAVRSMSKEDVAKAFHDTTLIVDEAHHIQGSQKGAANSLGRLLCQILDLDDPTAQVLLATAFFFRGDHIPILDDAHLELFTRHHVPFDEYWNSLTYLKSYKYEFVTYGASLWKELESLLKKDQSPTIIYCPPENHAIHQRKPKRELVDHVVRLLKKHYRGSTLWKPGIGDSERNVIIDFVDPSNRAEKIAFAMKHGERIAAILTVGMFREGADWVQAKRVIDLIPSNSDQDRNQRFGRLIRDYEGKESVEYFSFFPCSVTGNPDDQRRCLTNLFAHFQATLVLDNAVHPLKVRRETSPGRRSSGRDEYIDFLGTFDGQTQQTILKESLESLIELAADCEARDTPVKSADARSAIIETLDSLSIVENQEELAKQVVALFRRRFNPDFLSSELVDAGFDKVWSVEILEGIRAYSAGVNDAQTFEEIRQIVSKLFERRWFEAYGRVSQMTRPPASDSKDYWWITHNKVLYQQRKLSQKLIDLLEKISWWRWTKGFESRWEERYEAIRQLPEPPKSGTDDYGWLHQQRRLYKKGRLTQEKISACEEIPWWEWETNRDKWPDEYRRISKGKMPKAPSADADWVKYQRRRFTEGKLAPDRVRMLEAIPWWSWGV